VTDIHSDKAETPARETRDTAGNRLAAKRAAKAARKAATRGTSNPADDVARSVTSVTDWLEVHGRTIWLAVGGLVVVAIGGAVASNLVERGQREAGALLHTAVVTSHGIIIAPEETPPEDAIVPTFTSVIARDEKALSQYRDVQKKAESSPAARYAALGEANTLFGLGKAAEASTAFEKLRTELGQAPDKSAVDDADSFLRFRSLEGAGYALEAQQKYADARQRFEALSKLDKGAYRTSGDYHQARMLVAEGKRDEAKKLLEALTKAAADKPADVLEPGDEFETTVAAAQTLLVELGGQPVERTTGAGSGISQQVLDSLRKQLGNAKK